MSKVLIDTNVCLDAGQRRQPYAAVALEILTLSENGKFTGMIAAHSFDTIFYFLLKKYSQKSAYEIIKGLRRTAQVAPVTQHVIDAAIDSNWNDFEDSIHYQAALASDCEAIITRSERDFSDSRLVVYSPNDFLDQLKKQ